MKIALPTFFKMKSCFFSIRLFFGKFFSCKKAAIITQHIFKSAMPCPKISYNRFIVTMLSISSSSVQLRFGNLRLFLCVPVSHCQIIYYPHYKRGAVKPSESFRSLYIYFCTHFSSSLTSWLHGSSGINLIDEFSR